MNTLNPTDNDETQSGSAEDLVAALTGVIDQTVRALADAGMPAEASRFAARAWASLRASHPDEAERLNRAMHYLARREAELMAELEVKTP